jgi:hypothetical protein
LLFIFYVFHASIKTLQLTTLSEEWVYLDPVKYAAGGRGETETAQEEEGGEKAVGQGCQISNAELFWVLYHKPFSMSV